MNTSRPLRLPLSLSLVLATGCAHVGGPGHAQARGYSARLMMLPASDGGPAGRAVVKLPARETFPAVLYLDGSGCRSVVHLMHLLDPAVQGGWAVIALEKPGVATGDGGQRCSKEFQETDTRERRQRDAMAAVTRLAEALPGWNRELMIIAASEATTFAPAVARAVPGLRALVLLGGGGWTQARELEAAQEERLRWAGASERERVAASEQLRGQLAAIARAPDADATFLGLPYRRWSSYLDYDPLPDLLALDLPIYMANGVRDAMVPVASARAVSAAFAAAGKKNLTAREYEGLDHRWTDPDGTSRFPEVAKDLVEWAGSAALRGSVVGP